MTKICSGCLKEYPDSQSFCTGCGSKLETAEQQAAYTPPPQPGASPQPGTYSQPGAIPQPGTYSQQGATPQQGIYPQQSAVHGVVSTGYYFGMMFVYSLPVIGWLICLITAFANKNDNKKHFARAILIWFIISAVLSVGIVLIFSLLGGVLAEYINGAGSAQLGEFEDILKQFENSGFTPPVN